MYIEKHEESLCQRSMSRNLIKLREQNKKKERVGEYRIELFIRRSEIMDIFIVGSYFKTVLINVLRESLMQPSDWFI